MPEKNRKKVLYLITKSNWGGAQRYVYDLATSLDKEQFEPIVALGGNGTLKELLEHAHIRTIPIATLQRDVSLKKEFAFAHELSQILKQEKPDVLHVNSSKAGAMGTLLGRIHGVKRVIFTAHGWAFNEQRPVWQKIILKIIHWITVLFSHKTIAVSSTIATQLRWPFIASKFIIINPGRTIGPMYGKREAREKLAGLFPTLQPHLSKKWILTIAELHPIKRQDILINAMPAVHASDPNTIALVIGEGEQRDSLEQLIKTTETSNYVFLPGKVTEAARFLKAADIFTLTSDSESYGYVIHEAGIAGIPVISTQSGGVIDIIDDESKGVIIPKGSVSDLETALIETLKNKETAGQKAASLQTALQSRSKEKMVAATETIYQLPLK